MQREAAGGVKDDPARDFDEEVVAPPLRRENPVRVVTAVSAPAFPELPDIVRLTEHVYVEVKPFLIAWPSFSAVPSSHERRQRGAIRSQYENDELPGWCELSITVIARVTAILVPYLDLKVAGVENLAVRLLHTLFFYFSIHHLSSYSVAGVPRRLRTACGDCAALPGQVHVPGCDMEQCPASRVKRSAG
jgi:hypothetical protein